MYASRGSEDQYDRPSGKRLKSKRVYSLEYAVRYLHAGKLPSSLFIACLLRLGTLWEIRILWRGIVDSEELVCSPEQERERKLFCSLSLFLCVSPPPLLPVVTSSRFDHGRSAWIDLLPQRVTEGPCSATALARKSKEEEEEAKPQTSHPARLFSNQTHENKHDRVFPYNLSLFFYLSLF